MHRLFLSLLTACLLGTPLSPLPAETDSQPVAEPTLAERIRGLDYEEPYALRAMLLAAEVKAMIAEDQTEEARQALQTFWLEGKAEERLLTPQLSFLVGTLMLADTAIPAERAAPFFWQAWRREANNGTYATAFRTVAAEIGLSLPPVPGWTFGFLSISALVWLTLGMLGLWGAFAFFLLRHFAARRKGPWTVLIFVLLIVFIIGAAGVFSHYRWERSDLLPVASEVFVAPSLDSPVEGELPALAWIIRLERFQGYVEISHPSPLNGWIPLAAFNPSPFPENTPPES
jgi:hypothetical protein